MLNRNEIKKDLKKFIKFGVVSLAGLALVGGSINGTALASHRSHARYARHAKNTTYRFGYIKNGVYHAYKTGYFKNGNWISNHAKKGTKRTHKVARRRVAKRTTRRHTTYKFGYYRHGVYHTYKTGYFKNGEWIKTRRTSKVARTPRKVAKHVTKRTTSKKHFAKHATHRLDRVNHNVAPKTTTHVTKVDKPATTDTASSSDNSNNDGGMSDAEYDKLFNPAYSDNNSNNNTNTNNNSNQKENTDSNTQYHWITKPEWELTYGGKNNMSDTYVAGSHFLNKINVQGYMDNGRLDLIMNNNYNLYNLNPSTMSHSMYEQSSNALNKYSGSTGDKEYDAGTPWQEVANDSLNTEW